MQISQMLDGTDVNANDQIADSVAALNDIFKAAGQGHFLAAVAGEYKRSPAIRIVLRSGVNRWGGVIEGGMANLKGEDMMRLYQAFNDQGIRASQFADQLAKTNGPAIAIRRMRDDDPIQYAHLVRERIFPFEVTMIRPDADFLRRSAAQLATAIREKFAPPAPNN